MSDQQRQHLSALVDEEADVALVRVTVSALESNSGLKGAWESYHLIGAAIRSEPICGEYRRIASLVEGRIAEEPLPAAITQRPERSSLFGLFGLDPRWLAPFRFPRAGISPVAGAALAASAAFFAVFALPPLFDPAPDTRTTPNRLTSYQSAATPPEQFLLSSDQQGLPRRWHVDEPALESKLDRFLVHHQEQSPASGMKGFLPYATVVGYERR